MTSSTNTRTTRRTFLGTTGTAALLTAARAALPYGAHAAGSGPETTKAVLGFIALTDASPLVIAKEKGFFAKHGMPDVEVVKQASWGATRDNLVLGSAAQRHRRRPHPDADALPDHHRQGDPEQPAACRCTILARLNLDGQAISVGNELKPI